MSKNCPPAAKGRVLVTLLALSISCFAAEPPKELTALKENFAKVLERTTKPLHTTYEAELSKLMEKLTKAGELETALAVKAELEGTAPAANASPPPAPLVELKANYTRAVERASEPLRKTYKTELQKLLDRFTKSGDLEAAAAVKADMASFSGDEVVVSAPGGQQGTTGQSNTTLKTKGADRFQFVAGDFTPIEAEAKATELGARLASFKNASELQDIAKAMIEQFGDDFPYAIIGLSRESAQDPWKWADGTPLSKDIAVQYGDGKYPNHVRALLRGRLPTGMPADRKAAGMIIETGALGNR